MSIEAPTEDTLRRWRAEATQGLANAIEAAPDATVPAYPEWDVRDLAIHVVRIYGNATVALRDGWLERPDPRFSARRDDPPGELGDAVRVALEEAETALAGCGHPQVWAPVGARGPGFWSRRLLREAVLHRWDAQQAGGEPAAPAQEHAVELIDEFVGTDVSRALAADDERPEGVVAIRAGGRQWSIDLLSGTIGRRVQDADDAEAGIAVISGQPATVWLWLMRRDGLPGEVAVDDDVHGSGAGFAAMIDRFNRPSAPRRRS